MRWVFGADVKPFQRGLNTMRTQTQAFSRGVKGMLLGAFGMGAIIAGFRNLFSEMDRIHKLSIRFGETTETMQRLAHAADLNGSNLEVVANAMGRVTKNAYEAATGNEKLAAQFANIGIQADEFVNLPLEEKILNLAAAYDMGKGSGEAMAQMMQLLGRAGSELIPLLAEGQQKLHDQMENTSVVSDSTVQSIKNFNDSITELKKNAQVAGAAVFDGFRLIFGTIGQVIFGAVELAMISLRNLVDGATDAGSVIKKIFSGDLRGAASSAASLAGRFKTQMGDVKSEAQSTANAIVEMFNDIFDPASSGPQDRGPDVDDLIAAAEAAKKVEEEKLKLVEEIAKMQEEARMKDLSLAEQILEIEKKRAGIIHDMENAGDDLGTLQKQKELLEINKELDKLKDTRSKDQEKSANDIATATADMSRALADAATDEAKSDRDRKFRSLDDDGKIEMLKNEQEELMRQSDEAGKIGDFEGQIRRRIEAKEKGDEILSIAKDALSNIKGPTIATSSLASIGAGGSANLLTGDTNEKRKISLLETIANNTSRGETGSSNIPEPI